MNVLDEAVREYSLVVKKYSRHLLDRFLLFLRLDFNDCYDLLSYFIRMRDGDEQLFTKRCWGVALLS